MIDILLIATKNYHQFVPQMLDSLAKHLKIPYNVILFTDEPKYDNIQQVEIGHAPYPYITLFRYHYFLSVQELMTGTYQLYIDIDARFVQDIGEEILGDLIAVRHCGFYFSDLFPQEENPKSPLFKYKFTKYYGGGLQGGIKSEYLKAIEWCRNKIDECLDAGLLPETPQRTFRLDKNVALRHHDETVWNCYLSQFPPTKELSPDFHFPQECYEDREEWKKSKEHFIFRWQGKQPFSPKLILLKKDNLRIHGTQG